MLQELVQKLQKDHGLTAAQSTGILSTVSGFIKEKFPMMKDAVDNIFEIQPAATQAETPKQTASTEQKAEHSIIDKISDMIPGQAGEKIEDFAKGAANKAEEVFDNVKDKLSGLFGGNKN